MRIITLLLLILSTNVFAGVEVQSFSTQQQEQSYKKLVTELRCLVCQNQNLADSNAELARDLRKKIVKMIKAGKTEQEIIQYMVARYGDFVLYRPPMNQRTFLLWLGPFFILLIGLFIMFVFVRRQKTAVRPLSSDEQQNRAKKLIDDEEDD
ncbi:MAG: cytochrome c-type biogenesis protein CcmH [Gammaproteobacteria bacterium]